MKKRFLSLMIALAMMVGVFTPLLTSAEDESKDPNAVTNTVTLHKILMDKENLNIIGKRVTVNTAEAGQPEKKETRLVTEKTVKKEGTDVKKYYVNGVETDETDKFVAQYIKEGGSKLFQGQIGIDNTDYNGNALKIENYFGNSSKDIGGVYFAWAKKDTDGKYYWIKSDGNFTATKTEVKENELAKLPDDTFGGKTEDNKGIQFTTLSFKGEYKIYEIHEKSTYKGKNGETLTAMKAVPVVITLPLVNEKGTVKNAHVYPKNTEDKPEIDKNFGKKDNTTDNKTANDLAHAEGFDKADEKAGAQSGAKYENYEKTKETAKAEIGKKIPYEVKTKIPANSHLATAKWDDKMTEGLTYNKDLVVKINGTKINPTADELVQTDNGFELNLKGDNLALLNGKDKDVEVELQYSATVNKNAMADIPESNNVMFHYGNTPNKGTTPIPTNPKNGELEVKKTWDNGVWAKGESATFKLIDANTGKEVTAEDLVAPEGDQTAFNAYKGKFSATATIGYNAENGGSHKWQYLDNTKEYIAKEVSSTSGSDAEYKKSDDGTITVVNHKSDNPTPLNPTSPKVVTGGKKFVKTVDKDAKDIKAEDRLAGAEFYVKNSKNEYLVAKTSTEQNAANVDLSEKKKALDAAIKAYNELTAEQQKTDTEKKAAIDKAQKDYNDAFKAAAQNYKWEKDSTNAVLLVSDSQGRFEITGLEYGTYKLEEKTAPKGYAKRNDVDFTVAKGSYDGKKWDDANKKFIDEAADEHIQYNKDDKKAGYGLQVINKTVTIPQTGGIGTIIFTAIGLAIMASAVIAIKKRQATEAR